MTQVVLACQIALLVCSSSPAQALAHGNLTCIDTHNLPNFYAQAALPKGSHMVITDVETVNHPFLHPGHSAQALTHEPHCAQVPHVGHQGQGQHRPPTH